MKRRFLCVVMAVCLMTAVLSGCGNMQSAEPADSDKTEEAISSEEVSAEKTEEAANSEELPDETTNGEGEEAAMPAVPIAVTIEDVTDILTEERGCEIYEYPKFYLSEEDKNAYPELSKVFESYNSEMDSQKEAVLEQLEKNYKEATENSGDADAWHEMSIEITARALRADSNVVSLLCEYDAALGGAHPYSYVYGMNYDAKTGKKLTLGDVVKERDAFIKLVSDAFVEAYSDTDGYDTLKNAGEALQECDFDSDEGILWSIDPMGVTAYFEPYRLGTYAHGEQAVTIYFDEAPEVFEERYTMACEDYVLPISERKPLSIPSASGGREEISVELVDSNEYDVDYFGAYKMVYTIGDTTLKAEWNCFGATAYLVHVNGKNYIYAFQGGENDWTYLSVVDTEEKVLDDEQNVEACLKEEYESNDTEDSYECIVRSVAFTNPSEFKIGFGVDVIGTYHVYLNCSVGSNGYPVTDDTLYASGSHFAFRALKDIECDTVDRAGNGNGKAIIPAGSYLAVVRTDGVTIADLQIIDISYIENPGEDEWEHHLTENIEKIADPDGTFYRVTVDRSDYPYKVNGEAENSLFGEIMYAG